MRDKSRRNRLRKVVDMNPDTIAELMKHFEPQEEQRVNLNREELFEIRRAYHNLLEKSKDSLDYLESYIGWLEGRVDQTHEEIEGIVRKIDKIQVLLSQIDSKVRGLDEQE